MVISENQLLKTQLEKVFQMVKFNDIKTDHGQKSEKLRPIIYHDSQKDGILISDVLISSHGLSTDRFRKLPYERMLYCEELLCSIVQNLCAHLTVLSDIRKNSPVIGLPPPC